MTFNSHISLTPDVRMAIVDRLNIHLANTLDLQAQVKQSHWTIKGPQFFARHELFDKVANRLRAQADDTAERISNLGGYPEGTLRMAAKASTLPAFDASHVAGGHLLRDLTDRLSVHASTTRDMLTHVGQEDPVSADMLTSHLREVERDLWFFDSHFAE